MNSTRHIVGVRFGASSTMHFYSVDNPAIEVGTWVKAPVAGGWQAARVVLAPDRIVLAELDREPPSIAGLLSAEEACEMNADVPYLPPPSESRRIGSLGSQTRGRNRESRENDIYKQAKQVLPRLGQTVSTAEGEGIVVALQVFKKLVTIRYHDPERDVTVPAATLGSDSEH